MVFSEQPKPVEKINYKDINFLSQQLEAFIKVYKKKVLMDDDRYHIGISRRHIQQIESW